MKETEALAATEGRLCGGFNQIFLFKKSQV
jgi:hypothetical protein